MSNLNRVLTLRVNIKDPEAAKVLWDAHLKHELVAGCEIRAIGDGDLFAERDLLQEYVDYADETIDMGKDMLTFDEWKAVEK